VVIVTEHTECAVCGYEPDPDRIPPHYVLSLADGDIDDEHVESYPFGGSLSVPFACSDECWLDAQDDPELVTDGGVERDWDYVEGVIRDLKIDGYEVTEFESNTSNARPEKAFLLRVERSEDSGGQRD
jgi:hypothetical protein